MAETARYIEVPPDQWPPLGRSTGGGAGSRESPAPEGAGHRGGASSLVQYKGITDTVSPSPFLVADAALQKMSNLPKDDWRHAYDQVCYQFVQYLDRSEQKGFMVKGYDTKKGRLVNLPMEYDNRWGARSRRDLKEKLERLEFWFEMQQDRPVTMITLTCYHEGVSIPAAWQMLNDSRTKLLKLIRKYFGDVDYFWVPEPHKSGYVHYHLAVFADVSNNVRDNKGKGIEDKFRDIWATKYKTGSHTYGLDFSQKKNSDKIQHLKNYLSKYLQKGFAVSEWSIGLLLFNAHLWDTGFRMYGASNHIREMMNVKDKDDSSIVWLETKMQTREKTPDRVVDHGPFGGGKEVIKGEEVDIEKVIWYRQYIPDWLDVDRWILPVDWWLRGKESREKVLLVDPPELYFCDWGRPPKGNDPKQGEVKTVELSERQKRKLERDGYL